MKKRKIIRIIARLNIGGPAIHAILLTAGLNKEKFESILITGAVSASEGDMSYLAQNKGVAPVLINELGREISWKDDLAALWKIFKIIRDEQPDIVHTHTAKAGALGRLVVALVNYGLFFKVKSRNRIKLVHTFHGHVFHSYFGWLKSNIFIFIERFLALITDKIVVISCEQANDISNKYNVCNREKISIVPLGLDLDKYLYNKCDGARFRSEFSIKNDCLLIGLIGRLVPVKNHKMFFDAAKMFAEKFPGVNIKFVVIGDGELRNELDNYAIKLGFKNGIIFAGWREKLEDIYPALDFVALTSFNEGTPVSIIEALASGKAIIATNVGGVPDLMGKFQKTDGNNGKASFFENGILVESGDTLGFVDALNFLIENKSERFALGLRGKAFVESKFNIARLASDIEKLYESI